MLIFFSENNFKVSEMARLLCVSKRTIERGLQDNNLNVRDTYSQLTDSELEEEVRKVTSHFPYVGYRTVQGILLCQGQSVQEHRLRQTMRNIDLEGVLFRKLFITACRIHRRTYSVRGPQAFWHIDGYHKLIRWRFVVHGGIDGYLRLPVYLQVSTNNTSEAVLYAFEKAVSMYGLPERVRSDKGLENALVAEYMLTYRIPEDNPFIAGRSVHYQRIERLWKEIWSGFGAFYHQLFHEMKGNGILDIDNGEHIQALYLVFLERLPKHLNQFREALMHRKQ